MIKSLLIFPLLAALTAFTYAQSAADKVLAEYYKEVGLKIAKAPRALGGIDGVLKKYEELGNKHLIKNKEILHVKAVKDYLALPELKFTALEDEKKIAWVEVSKFHKGNVVMPELAKTDLEQLVLLFAESGYGIPPLIKQCSQLFGGIL